ncbi:MAG: hypothetical protein GX800_10610 [Clostridiaceae bacterium]|nr:hypothetical protein [Clostridiaceae bacterium]
MRDFLKSDIASRVIALAIAIILWIYVVILLDPPIDIVFNDIPVLYTNTVDLTKEGYVLTNEKTETVSVKVRGSRTMLAKINKSEISAFADLNGYFQTGTITVPISVGLPIGELSIIEKKPYGVNVTIDKIISQSFPVTVEITGTPEPGFEVYESIASQRIIELKGPSELIASIEKAVVSIDVTGVSDDIMVTRPLVFYNTNQNVVSSRHLTSVPETIEIRSEVLQRKTDLVKAKLTDDNGGFVANVIPSNQITVLGKPNVLEQINFVDTNPISLSGITSDTKVVAKLDLPKGIVGLGNISEVTVEIKHKTGD